MEFMKDHVCAPSRRRMLASGAIGLTGLWVCGNAALAEQGLAPTPACHDGDEPTLPRRKAHSSSRARRSVAICESLA